VTRSLDEWGKRALAEAGAVLARMPADAHAPLARELAAARRIAVHSAGRTGLILRGLAMRLFHLGLDAHVVGDMTCPPLGAGDLLLVNAATGDLPSGLAHIASAGRAGARVAVTTAGPDGPAARAADLVLHVPGQTMANDLGGAGGSALPMGSQYELALFAICEVLVLELMDARSVDFAAMRARHANLL
jgi:6-phospho-3-hexuloisomerase